MPLHDLQAATVRVFAFGDALGQPHEPVELITGEHTGVDQHFEWHVAGQELRADLHYTIADTMEHGGRVAWRRVLPKSLPLSEMRKTHIGGG